MKQRFDCRLREVANSTYGIVLLSFYSKICTASKVRKTRLTGLSGWRMFYLRKAVFEGAGKIRQLHSQHRQSQNRQERQFTKGWKQLAIIIESIIIGTTVGNHQH